MATPLPLISNNESSSIRNPALTENQPESRPDQNPPKPRSRKGGKSGQGLPGAPKKPPQRGMGVAQLERLLRQQQNQAQVTSQQQFSPQIQCPFHHHVNPLAGVPVQPGRLAYGLPVHSAQRVGPIDADHDPRLALGFPGRLEEFPSMQNPELQSCQLDPSFKKKRVIVDDVGFMRGRNRYVDHQINLGGLSASNFVEFDMMNNGDNSHYLAINGGTSHNNPGGSSEVVAIHKKGNGSTIVMMKEYEFFPDKSEAKGENVKFGNSSSSSNNNFVTNYISSNINNYDNNYYYYNNNNNNEMEDYMLNLRMGSSNPDHSPSSSLSSLSPPANDNAPLDLSLKL